MTTRDLLRLCDAAEKQARRKRHVGDPEFIVPMLRPATSRGVALVPDVDDTSVDVPRIHGEIEAAGDGEDQATLARFACRDVRRFLAEVTAALGPCVVRLRAA